ncbi:protein of unknown function [Rhodovastum atsumiense]|nr:protein of unknown function [Rhodovastum atsumiense]
MVNRRCLRQRHRRVLQRPARRDHLPAVPRATGRGGRVSQGKGSALDPAGATRPLHPSIAARRVKTPPIASRDVRAGESAAANIGFFALAKTFSRARLRLRERSAQVRP